MKLCLKLISDTRMVNKNTVWKCGTAMEKAWDGTILLVVFQHFSFARLNQSHDAKSYLLYGLICIPFSHIYLAYCGRALQTKIQFYESLSMCANMTTVISKHFDRSIFYEEFSLKVARFKGLLSISWNGGARDLRYSKN